uniref:Uncharacterized protein n=1 Tax=Anopheles minimus TaxID=112268 RepID=A0A182WND5_9DIPT
MVMIVVHMDRGGVTTALDQRIGQELVTPPVLDALLVSKTKNPVRFLGSFWSPTEISTPEKRG